MTGSRQSSTTSPARGRIDIAKKIEAARDEGDLRENGGYHAAKDEQGQIEARIITLQHILENARVGGPPRTDGVVGPGMTVTIRFVKDEDEVTFLLASREESGSPIDVYSPRSPLGAAIMGKKVGEKATYSLPNGRATTVEILEAVPYVGASPTFMPNGPWCSCPRPFGVPGNRRRGSGHELGLLGRGLPGLRRGDPAAQRDLLDEEATPKISTAAGRAQMNTDLHRVRDGEEHVVPVSRRAAC